MPIQRSSDLEAQMRIREAVTHLGAAMHNIPELCEDS